MQKPSVLLIDDDDSLRRVIEYSLTEAGYVVTAAARGEQGLRLFSRNGFDAVITDITMPGMSGMEVLSQVRQRDGRIPVIIITAYGTIESAVEAMKQGAFDYITKPVSRDELATTKMQRTSGTVLCFGQAFSRRLTIRGPNTQKPGESTTPGKSQADMQALTEAFICIG